MGGLFAAVGLVALLLLAGGGGGKGKKPIAKPCNTPDDLDEPMRTTVKTALLNEKDPSVLDVMAKSLLSSCPSVAAIVQARADALRKVGTGGGAAPKTKVDCAKSSTWPSDVQSMWTEYQAHKADGATSAYATSGKASKLYARFIAIGCGSNATTVQKTIQAWMDATGSMPGGVDCKDSSTWPSSLKSRYDDYQSNPCDWVAAGILTGAAPKLVADLAAQGCTGASLAVQHTIDLVNGGLCGPGTGSV